MYVQQDGTYPEVNSLLPELYPFLHAPWPANNYAGRFGRAPFAPDAYLGPRQGVYCCPGYNRVQGQFWDEPGLRRGPVPGVGECEWAFGRYAYNSEGMERWAEPLADHMDGPELNGLDDTLGSYGTGDVKPYPNGPGWHPIHESDVVAPSDVVGLADSVLTSAWYLQQGIGIGAHAPVPTGRLDLGRAMDDNYRGY